MKHYLLRISVLVLSVLTGYSQNKPLSDPQPYFTAIIVKDIEVSNQWYLDNLGFEIIKYTDLKERGIKQSNLKRGDALIELIELSNAINPKDLVDEKTKKTRFTGYFKFGFSVVDFDNWIVHLNNSDIKFQGSIVTDAISGKRMVIIKDPDGNRIQLFEK